MPETDQAALVLGADITVSCDGCATMNAKITYLAAQSQTTSVIYSRQKRGRLAYPVEAELVAPDTLQPGSPVIVMR
ncbi:MAG: hypothetical protein MO846_10940 [Candidatus Devosia symbiotica]|nr:hypothetical protein [Candidatus Devosia symbiotica]